MSLDPAKNYVFRNGSDNQHRIFWDGTQWKYEFLAGGVLFDEQGSATEEGISEIISFHGLVLNQFAPDLNNSSADYSREIKDKLKRLEAQGIRPCPKHGLSAKNEDGSCEACDHPDYFDDFKGTEG